MIDRLRRENEQLNHRVDSLIQMLEREQVLRQQMQGQLDLLMERLTLPPPAPEPPAPELPPPEQAPPEQVLPEHVQEQMAEQVEQQQALKQRLQATETKFDLLTHAVAELVAYLERRRS